MKRTAYLTEIKGNQYQRPTQQITCEVIGEMCDGRKVWELIGGSQEQYYLIKINKKYYFIQA